MVSRTKYPRKGEYGDSTPRCLWCGRRVYGELSSQSSTYCSFECSAAGSYYLNIFALSFMGILTVIAVLSTVQFGILNPNPLTSSWPLLSIAAIILGIFVLYLIVTLRLGYRIRKEDETYRWTEEKVIDHTEDLTSLHHHILDFVNQIPSNKGVTRRHILDHMKSKGALSGSTGIAIRELVGGGFLEEVSMGHYQIGKIRRQSQ